MAHGTRILGVRLDGRDGLIVEFSDGTAGAYVVEELLEMRPIRELIHKVDKQNPPPKKTEIQDSIDGARGKRRLHVDPHH